MHLKLSTKLMLLRINFSRADLLTSDSIPGGGGYSLIWAIWGRAAGQGMVFWLRCPKQGVQFDLALS